MKDKKIEDQLFDDRGGGLVNLALFARACKLPDSKLVVILGEESFHQIHGGTATNVPEQKNKNGKLGFCSD